MQRLNKDILFIIFEKSDFKTLAKLACTSSFMNHTIKTFRDSHAYRQLSALSLFDDKNRKLVMIENGRFTHREQYIKHKQAKRTLPHQHSVPANAPYESVFGGVMRYLVPIKTDNCRRCEYNIKSKPQNLFNLKHNLDISLSEKKQSDQDLVLHTDQDGHALYLHYSKQSLIYLYALISAADKNLISIHEISDEYLKHYTVQFFDAYDVSCTTNHPYKHFRINLKEILHEIDKINPDFNRACQEKSKQLLYEIGLGNEYSSRLIK